MTARRRYRIVVGIDFSDMSEVVLETAMDMAARHEAPDIHVVSVLSTPRGFRRQQEIDQGGELEELEGVMRSMVGDKLVDFQHPYGDLGEWRVYVHARAGAAAEQIAFLAWEAEADLIIVGRHGETGWPRLLMGSVPERVLRLARCPVLVVQPTDYGEAEVEEVPAVQQCAECVAVRRDSDGAQWFCEEHSDYKLSRSSYMAHHHSSLPVGSGPLL